MFRFVMLLLTMLLMLLFSGCTGENVWHGLYEGIRTRNDLQSPPPERFGKPESLDYSEYERMRKEQR
jgi:hypothetical protein